MGIRIIALDLDGTTLNSRNTLSPYNREAIEQAIARGVAVVIASGRVLSALPAEVLEVRGLRYAISSNGAQITDLQTGETLYARTIEPEAVREAIRISKEYGYPMEAFRHGRAYIDAGMYEAIVVHGSLHRNREYVMRTRKPLENIHEFMEEHIDQLENINFFFENEDLQEQARALIEAIPNATITSSVPNNLEIGGVNTSKAEAVRWLMEHLGLSRDHLMACGDARNDIPMIRLARVGVAVGNAWDEVKAAADYIAETNNEDGVGRAIHRFVLDAE